MSQACAAVLNVVDDANLVADELGEHDGRGVVHAQVPSRNNADLRLMQDVANALVCGHLLHLAAIVGPGDGRLKAALEFLVVAIRADGFERVVEFHLRDDARL